MAVLRTDGALHRLADDRRVGGGPCALVQKDAGRLVHGTCILQRVATEPTELDLAEPHRLIFADGRAYEVKLLKRTMSVCGPEIVRFEGPGEL